MLTLTVDRVLSDRLASALARSRVLAVVRERDASAAVAVARQLVRRGVLVLEVSSTTRDAVVAVAELAAEFASVPEVVLGLGTVIAPEQIAPAVAAGAAFVMSPTLSTSVLHEAADAGIVAIPGCFTPTEIAVSRLAGAELVKVFPANVWGPAGLAAMLQAMHGVRSIPTGGIALADVPRWLDAGAFAVGLGSSLRHDQPIPDLPAWESGREYESR